MTKAIFFDIDGTLLSFQTHTMSPAILEALHKLQEKGVKLFLSTGRHKSMIQSVLDLFPFDGCITLNGQYCFCGNTVLRKVPLDQGDVEQLVELTLQGAFPCIFLEDAYSYINEASPRCDVFPKQLSIPLPSLDDPRHALEHELYQVVAFL
ncbi:MAG: HAD-IIB family hydrolase, partial [Oscillibacter sp.]|nr:HAD-IIB family hydrolase [Oscillibacter sp.]